MAEEKTAEELIEQLNAPRPEPKFMHSIAIRYFSRGGHVKMMAEALSRGAGVEAISIDDPRAPITEHVDLLFIGGALYKWKIDDRLTEYISTLDSSLIDNAVCFGSSALLRRPVLLIQERLKERGIKINQQAVYGRNRPNDALLATIEYFAKQEATLDHSLDGLPPHMIFKYAMEEKEAREAAEAAAAEAEEGAAELPESAREAALSEEADE